VSAKYPQHVTDQAWLKQRLKDIDEAIADANRRAMRAANTGAAGTGGGGGSTTWSGYSQTFTAASSVTMSVPSGFGGRIPEVGVYLATGEKVIADVTASTTSVTVTFSGPYSGTILLT
jgi:hypothetical protein